MSEQGWREFLSADGIEDWVILHGGPTAVFKVGSLQEAARLAAAVAEVPGLEPRTILSAASDRLTVKLTREMWGTEARHIEVARAISTVARQHGANADRSAVQEVQLAVAARTESIDLGFWRAVLGYAELHEDNCVDPLGQSSTIWMQDLDPAKPLRHAMHIDVSVAREHAEARMTAAVSAGGRVVDESSAPGAWILADRSGNKVCIAAWPDSAPMPESSGIVNALRSSFERVLTGPTPDDLWDLQKTLLTVGGAQSDRARAVARAFHSCLRTLDSKSASRTASRWGAVLGTAAVASISLPELRDRQDRGLGELLEGALPAVLEIGAAVQTAAAWEIEAQLIYDEFAWFLYEELWDVSATSGPDMSAQERRSQIDAVLDPILDPDVSDADRATLVTDVFINVLAARVLPLLR